MVSADFLPEEWSILRQWLPQDLSPLAQEKGFFSRRSGLQDPDCWLRLILMHVAGGLSLKQTSVRARELGLAQVSSVALHKRLQRAEDWLASLTAHVLEQCWADRDAWRSMRPVRVIDATDIQEPGSTGTALRLHYSLRLPQLRCDHYELTDGKGGEKLGRFHFQAGEIVLADRGYSHRGGAASVIGAGADFVMRWHAALLPLVRDGQDFFPLQELRRLGIGEPAQWDAAFEWQGRLYPCRLCGLRKSRQAAEKARRKALRQARGNKNPPNPDYLELADYVLVLTSLPQEQMAAAEVLEFYRCRWQVELAFKRLKSLLAFGHVPKTSDETAKAWMQAKILVALLIEKVLCEGRFFSPWGYRAQWREPVAVFH
jgi:Transposase DDE domain